MIPRTNALLLCVVFLCGLQETLSLLSQRGHCAGNKCFVLFQESKNFPGAQKSCKGLDGQLFIVDSKTLDTISTILLSGLSGSYWLDLHDTGRSTEKAAAGLQVCSSISVSKERKLAVTWEPCSKNLDGCLCQYEFKEPCGRLKAGGDAQVKYTTHQGFEVSDSDSFPPGTIAVAKKVGSRYPDSKHVCFSSNWMAAPWSCEVLQGGCEHNCNSTTHTCSCPAGQTLQPNKFSCATDQCAACAHECQREGDTYVCKCRKGYNLAQDGRSCVDANECEEENPCAGEDEECLNTRGGYECQCKEGFVKEDGVCVNVTICERCEHMRCDKVNGVYQCACRKGFKVSAHDPTKCEMDCTETDCPANCIPNSDNKEDMPQCYCPRGYILHSINNTAMCSDINECELQKQCEHKCENLLGSFRCLCDEGFKLHKEYMCKEEEGDEGDELDGSGSAPSHPTPASPHSALVPSYIKTGSVLGITVFMLLCAALLFFLVYLAIKRCGRFDLTSFKHSNIDIFYLQQVTSETYKRLSFDKQSKNDPQILQSQP